MLSLGMLEWIGAVGGAAGALLLAFNNRWSGYGFVLFLVSNAAWMTYGVMTHTFGMVTMQIVCTGTSLLGVWRWLVLPRLTGVQAWLTAWAAAGGEQIAPAAQLCSFWRQCASDWPSSTRRSARP